jgi:large subunit ribosomal protein L13
MSSTPRAKTVGRLASRIAHILRGKHKPTFTPSLDTGDFIIVLNAERSFSRVRNWKTKSTIAPRRVQVR